MALQRRLNREAAEQGDINGEDFAALTPTPRFGSRSAFALMRYRRAEWNGSGPNLSLGDLERFAFG